MTQIGNRTRDLPVCSAVPKPTASPRAPKEHYKDTKIRKNMCDNNFLQVTEIDLGKLHGV